MKLFGRCLFHKWSTWGDSTKVPMGVIQTRICEHCNKGEVYWIHKVK